MAGFIDVFVPLSLPLRFAAQPPSLLAAAKSSPPTDRAWFGVTGKQRPIPPYLCACPVSCFLFPAGTSLGSPTSLCLRALALAEGNSQEELNFTHRDFKPLPGPHLIQSLWGTKPRCPDFQKRPPPPGPAQGLALLPFLWCSDIYPGIHISLVWVLVSPSARCSKIVMPKRGSLGSE